MFITATFLNEWELQFPIHVPVCLLDPCASRSCQQTLISQRIPVSRHSNLWAPHARAIWVPSAAPYTDYTVDLEQGWGWRADICAAKNPRIALGKSNSQRLASADSTNRESRRVFAIHGWEYEKIMFSIQGWLNPQMLRADNLLKKQCISGLVQFKTGLFKGHPYINWICRLEKGIFTQQ